MQEYLERWEQLEAKVADRDGHAWLFRASGGASEFMEFIEWREPLDGPVPGAPLPEQPAVAGLIGELGRCFGPALTEEWVGVPSASAPGGRQ